MSGVRAQYRSWMVVAAVLAAAGTLRAQDVSLSAEFSADRSGIYVYEPFYLTLSVSTTGIRLGQAIELSGLPDPAQLEIGRFEDLPVSRRIQGRTIYEVRRYRARCLPRRPGPLSLTPTLHAVRLVQRRVFFGRQWTETPVRLPLDPHTIEIAPLPTEAQPGDFSGAVGQFEFRVTVAPLDVAVGDLVRVTMRIEGEGYLADLPPPALATGDAFKTYDPRLLESGASLRVFEQILIPAHTNAGAVPAAAFTFFDPREQRYVTHRRGPFPLSFHAPRGPEAANVYRPDGLPGAAPPVRPPVAPLRPVTGATEADRETLADASKAYEVGYYGAALDAYRKALDSDPASGDLRYNLGTVYLGQGQHGHAVLHLARALGMDPDGEDARRNLAEALRRAGTGQAPADAVPPGLLGMRRRGLAVVTWLLAGGLLLFLAAAGRLERHRPVLLLAAVLLAAACFRTGHRALELRRHAGTAAVILRDESARLTPLATARMTFACPAGTLVSIVERRGSWCVIRRNGDLGWVPFDSLERLPYPER